MLLFLFTLLLGATNPEVSVYSLDGEKTTGTLVAFSDEQLTIDGAEERVLPLAGLQRIVFNGSADPAEDDASVWVELEDGSRLLARQFVVQGKQAKLTLLGGGVVELPVRGVRAVRLKSQDRDQQQEWQRIRDGEIRSDLLVIRKKERIDYLEGVLGDITAELVKFDLDGETIPVKRGKVEGVIFYHPGSAAGAPATFRLTDIYGTRIEGTSRKVTEAGIEVVSPAGLTTRWPFQKIRQIDFSAEKIVYLSDLEPVEVKWTPYFASPKLGSALRKFYLPTMDRALATAESASDDGLLRLAVDQDGNQTVLSYKKGVAIHSRTTMQFKMPDDVRMFRALVGIDARMRDHGHVQFVVRGDGKELFSATIDGNEQPQEVSVGVARVRRLELFVDYGEHLDIGDHLNLCNARLIK